MFSIFHSFPYFKLTLTLSNNLEREYKATLHLDHHAALVMTFVDKRCLAMTFATGRKDGNVKKSKNCNTFFVIYMVQYI